MGWVGSGAAGEGRQTASAADELATWASEGPNLHSRTGESTDKFLADPVSRPPGAKLASAHSPQLLIAVGAEAEAAGSRADAPKGLSRLLH